MSKELIIVENVGGEKISKPGVYRMPAEAYHADPCIQPSLSSSVAVEMIEKTPRHAWTKHPRLNTAPEDADEVERSPTRPMEIGSAAHKLLLGEGDEIIEIVANDYKKDAVKVERARAYAAGRQPILSTDLRRANKMAEAAKAQLVDSGVYEEFSAGHSEPVLIWQDVGGSFCRAMMDRIFIGKNRAIIFDLKTTATDLTQDGIGRRVVDGGYEMRAAFYERGLYHLFPHLAGKTQFIHLWLEVEPPYALLPADLDGAALTIGRKKAAAAIGMWAECMKAGEWPLYPPGVARVDYPIWAERNWLERETNDEHVAKLISSDPFLGASPFHISAGGKTAIGPV